MASEARDTSSGSVMFTRVVIVLAVLHFPLLFLRVGLFMGGAGPWMEVLIVGGPVAALGGSLVMLWRPSTRNDAMACALIFAGYCLMYTSCWLADPTAVFSIG